MLTLETLREITGYGSFTDFNANVQNSNFSDHKDEDGVVAGLWKYQYIDINGRNRRSVIDLTRDELLDSMEKEAGRHWVHSS
jgi:hypothetical protein